MVWMPQKYKRNELNFWNVHGIMNTLGLLQSKFTLQETRSIHDSMNRPKIEFIAHIFTFPLRVFKSTFTFEMLFIATWTDLFKPRQHTRCLGGPTLTPSNNVVCLRTFHWRRARIVMTLNAGFLAFWLFPTLHYVEYNLKYPENQPSYVNIENWYLTDNI